MFGAEDMANPAAIMLCVDLCYASIKSSKVEAANAVF